MALTYTLHNEDKSTTDAASQATGSVTLTPAAGRVFVAVMTISKATTPDTPTSVTGLSGTWTVKNNVACTSGSLKKISVYHCTDASGTGAITFDFNSVAQTGFTWYVVQIDGCDNGGTQGVNAFVQMKATSNTSNVTTTTVTFDGAFGSVNNGVLALALTNLNAIPAIEVGFTTATGQSNASPNMGSSLGWRSDNDTDPTATHGSGQSGMIAYEIKAASGSPYTLAVDVMALSLTMVAVALTAARQLVVGTMALSLTMQDVTLTYVQASGGITGRPGRPVRPRASRSAVWL